MRLLTRNASAQSSRSGGRSLAPRFQTDDSPNPKSIFEGRPDEGFGRVVYSHKTQEKARTSSSHVFPRSNSGQIILSSIGRLHRRHLRHWAGGRVHWCHCVDHTAGVEHLCQELRPGRARAETSTGRSVPVAAPRKVPGADHRPEDRKGIVREDRRTSRRDSRGLARSLLRFTQRDAGRSEKHRRLYINGRT